MDRFIKALDPRFPEPKKVVNIVDVKDEWPYITFIIEGGKIRRFRKDTWELM